MSKKRRTPTKDSALRRKLGTREFHQRVKPDKKQKAKRRRRCEEVWRELGLTKTEGKLMNELIEMTRTK